MNKYITSPLFTPVTVTLIWITWLCAIFIFYFNSLPLLLDKENGPLEIITTSAYFLLPLSYIAFYKPFMRNRSSKLDFILFVLLGCSAFLREMGIQHWLTSHDTTAFKSRFFLNPNNPLSEKIVAGALLLTLLAALIYLVVKYGKHLIVSFFKINPTTWSIATLCTIGIIAKFTDRFPSNYRKSHGFALPEQLHMKIEIIEETSETLLPLIVAFIFWQYWLLHKSKQNRN